MKTKLIIILSLLSMTCLSQDVIVKYGGNHKIEYIHDGSGDVTINISGPAEIPPDNDPIYGGDYFVATDGNDAYQGTQDRPFATWKKGIESCNAGDTVYIRGGIYDAPELTLDSSVVVSTIIKNLYGSAGNLIHVFAYPGETPIMDFTGLGYAYKNHYFEFKNCSYLHLKGLNFTGGEQGSSAYACAFNLNRVSHSIVEQCNFYGNEGPGVSIFDNSTDNLFLNCDSHDNYDDLSSGGNADGFSNGEGLAAGTTNTFRGCRSWKNSDDGYDMYSTDGIIVFDSCWAFMNGYQASGDGEGFKLGGDTDYSTGTNQRTVTNCLAYHNKDIGFYQNASPVLMHLYNNTSYDNDYKNICFWDPDVATTFTNNISYSGGDPDAFTASMVRTTNSWNTPPGATVSNADFASVDSTGISGERTAWGGLPVLNFMRLVTGSDLKDVGTDVGIDYVGVAPDLGCFEFVP